MKVIPTPEMKIDNGIATINKESLNTLRIDLTIGLVIGPLTISYVYKDNLNIPRISQIPKIPINPLSKRTIHNRPPNVNVEKSNKLFILTSYYKGLLFELNSYPVSGPLYQINNIFFKL